MAENNGAPRASAPIRPTITLPVRSSAESFFRGTETSPGPMTLVSSFFSEYDPESECRSFSQLLAGAMASPNAIPGRKFSFSGGNSDEVGGEDRDGGGSGEGGEAGFSFKQNRPFGLSVGNSPFFTVPPGLSPTSLLDSPGFFSSGQGPFGISHQQALAQVTAQAVQTQAQIHIQTEYPSSLSAVMAASSTHPTGPLVSAIPLQQMPPSTSDSKSTVMDSIDFSQSDQRTHPPPANVDKPSDDGYNWRKYGQKTVKGSEYPRSYYKCTHPNCPVKKKVERSFEGQVTEIIYKGQHNHQKPQQSKRAKEGAVLAPGSLELNGNMIVKSETDLQVYTGNVSRKNEIIAAASVARRDRDSSQATLEQLSGSSDCEEGDADIRTDEGDSDEPDSKRRNTDNRITESVPSHRTVTEPRVIVQTTSEVDILDDGYRWRKYGQKVVKGNPHPRSYYKCTNAGCNVRKHVERASTDPKAVITTYEGKHNHDVPAARNSSHNTANSSSATNIRPHSVLGNAASVNRMDSNNYEQKPVAVLRFRSNEDAF